MGQRGPQLSASTVDAASDCAELGVQDNGDLFVGETFDVAEHDRGPELRRQRGEGGSHVVIESGVGESLRRSRPAAGQALLRAVDETVEADLLLATGRVQE